MDKVEEFIENMIKEMKEEYNIKLPKDSHVYSMSEAYYEGLINGDPIKTREYLRSGKFSGVYIVYTESGDRGLLDAVNGVYIKPLDMIGIKLNENYIVLGDELESGRIILESENGIAIVVVLAHYFLSSL